MKESFKKHELSISILLIIIYVLINSYCMQNFGLIDYRSALVNVGLSIAIIVFIIKNRLINYYCLNSFPKANEFLFFIPLLLIISVNFWNGINIENTSLEILFYIITMICVGFLEEIIFRGFLFKAMAKDNLKSAIIVTSLTFGIGHIVNLINGAQFIPTFMQILYSTSIGFLFVVILLKAKSLWPCIITHVLINCFAIFNNQYNTLSLYIIPVFLVVVSISYTIYIMKKIK